ncbi:MAG: hypothetical protein MZV64_37730 [Ignavibacteriales bacterium]|nr:hypothetical protein [Ignavibacteriales bacterium]
MFSLDGVHPTSRGQGIIANEFIKVINAKWGTSIPFSECYLQIPGSLILAKMSSMGLPIFEKGTLDNLLILTAIITNRIFLTRSHFEGRVFHFSSFLQFQDDSIYCKV